MIIGFWKRFLSDILDTFFLALFGLLLTFVCGDSLYDLGPKGGWIGLAVCFLYTGLLQSSLGEGQSLAKRLLGIQVLSMNGKFLSLPKSFLRYAVIALFAYYGTWGLLLGPLQGNQFIAFLSFALVTLAFLGCFLMVPFHPLKRGLHDLLAGSVVVKKGTFKKSLVKLDKEGKKKEIRVRWIWGGCSLVVLAAFAVLTLTIGRTVDMGAILAIQDRVLKESTLREVQVTLNTHTSKGKDGEPGKNTRSLVIVGWVPKGLFENNYARDREADLVAAVAVQESGKFQGLDHIRVVLIKGFKLGIWSMSHSQAYVFDLNGKRRFPK